MMSPLRGKGGWSKSRQSKDVCKAFILQCQMRASKTLELLWTLFMDSPSLLRLCRRCLQLGNCRALSYLDQRRRQHQFLLPLFLRSRLRLLLNNVRAGREHRRGKMWCSSTPSERKGSNSKGPTATAAAPPRPTMA